ncbi:hypothetical protein SD77_1870 [Bacillus badius]|uniref:Uncharacterized protein n=1 Tax=Bacillus badius TaxID=1455 RepID=A0ABR5AQ81_BACBA|nr:hypothetical protein SD78_0933 [Bacillus badius]KIL76910.1 hypothetical protein SD77_1870 [Bacillus badius]KZR58215.1 hypothetical protein A3781_18615 [Bacillus badius]
MEGAKTPVESEAPGMDIKQPPSASKLKRTAVFYSAAVRRHDDTLFIELVSSLNLSNLRQAVFLLKQ